MVGFTRNNHQIILKPELNNFFFNYVDKKSYEEAAKRLKLEHVDREKIIPKLREESRRKYLEKRKEDKITELEADIVDDEYLFNEDE